MSFLDQDLTTHGLLFPTELATAARASYPFDLASGSVVEEHRLAEPVLFQVVGLENISELLIAQLDHWESLHDPSQVSTDKLRGVTRTGVIVRDVDLDAGDQPPVGPAKPAAGTNRTRTFKLTLQDGRGNLCYGFEEEKLSWLCGAVSGSAFPVALGCKVVVKPGTVMVKGVFFLTEAQVTLLGGSIPALNANLPQRQVERLTAAIGPAQH